MGFDGECVSHIILNYKNLERIKIEAVLIQKLAFFGITDQVIKNRVGVITKVEYATEAVISIERREDPDLIKRLGEESTLYEGDIYDRLTKNRTLMSVSMVDDEGNTKEVNLPYTEEDKEYTLKDNKYMVIEGLGERVDLNVRT